MHLYKNSTGHRYWCILSKYTVLVSRWPYLSTKIWWIWNTDWFQLVIHSIGSTSSITSLVNISVISWSFFKIFLLNIGLINTYKMPPHLPSYLIRALRYSSVNIWKIGTWPPVAEILYAIRWKWHHSLICIWTNTMLCVSQCGELAKNRIFLL